MAEIKIAIIGSGTSGLSAAISLIKDGHDVQLFERFHTPKPIGAGLLLQPTGLACLATMNLDDKIIDYGTPVIHLDCRAVSGAKVFDISYHTLAKHIFGLGVHRGSLFTVLYHEAKRLNIRINTDCQIVDSCVEQDKRLIIDHNGNQYGPFDLVIDASGMRSPLRDRYGHVKLNKPYPYGAVWGVCQDSHQQIGKDILQQRYHHASIMLGILPIGRQPDNEQHYCGFFWSLSVNSYQNWRENGMTSWKEQVVNYWPQLEVFMNQFQHVDDLTFAQYGDIIMKPWHADKLVFIGDAAHCTSPQLGQGANLGIIDAVQLARCLRQEKSIPCALDNYSKTRRRHIKFYQSASRWLTPFFQSDSKLAGWVRDHTLGMMCKMPYIKTEMIRTLSGMKTGLFSHINPGIWHSRYDLHQPTNNQQSKPNSFQ